MNKLTALLLGTMLAIAFAMPALANDGLRTPRSVSFGRQVIGACDTETLAGCKLKTIRITNTSSEPILISGFIYRGDVSFGIGFTVGDCISLPIVESNGRNYLSLAAGTSCTRTITAAPLTLGRAAGRIEVTGVTQFDVIGTIAVRTTGI